MSMMRGAAAGFAATIPMTLAMEALRAWLPREQHRPMPPREIVDHAVAKTGEGDQVGETNRIFMTTASHLMFGAAAGALYGGIVGSRRASVLSGVGYGVAVWAVAYGVGLPWLGLHRGAANDTKDRNEVLIGSHVVWGAVLGALTAKPDDSRRKSVNAAIWNRGRPARVAGGGRSGGTAATAASGAFRR